MQGQTEVRSDPETIEDMKRGLAVIAPGPIRSAAFTTAYAQLAKLPARGSTR